MTPSTGAVKLALAATCYADEAVTQICQPEQRAVPDATGAGLVAVRAILVETQPGRSKEPDEGHGTAPRTG